MLGIVTVQLSRDSGCWRNSLVLALLRINLAASVYKLQ